MNNLRSKYARAVIKTFQGIKVPMPTRKKMAYAAPYLRIGGVVVFRV